jgi:hypothetical protein
VKTGKKTLVRIGIVREVVIDSIVHAKEHVVHEDGGAYQILGVIHQFDRGIEGGRDELALQVLLVVIELLTQDGQVIESDLSDVSSNGSFHWYTSTSTAWPSKVRSSFDMQEKDTP